MIKQQIIATVSASEFHGDRLVFPITQKREAKK
jgi:hypothetical protein